MSRQHETRPATMRAVRIDAVGPPENLRVVDCPVPTVGDDDVLIRTEIAGIIYGDVEARKGSYFTPTRVPWIPGREVAGVVATCGRDVKGYEVGARVMALVPSGGCYAEYVLTSPGGAPPGRANAGPPADIQRLPDRVAFREGLVYLVNFRLAHLVLHAVVNVRRGDAVAVHGAAGGMGAMVTQLAKAAGCEVIALCRGSEEVAFCRAIGAARAFDTSSTDYVDAVLDATGGEGVRYSFNGVGGPTVNRDPLIVSRFGEIVLYGYVAGKAAFDPFALGKTYGLKLFSATDYLKTPRFAEATEAMHAWMAEQPLLSISETWPFEQAPDAHRRIEAGTFLCKLGLTPR
ncbi:zinc-binding dehydrogenase [Burkholderia sp. FERM BP-3421]|uniref:quinone oxidoreductase family protein n=1 Tax=Burkholderia sp. FERM BP-3421 TaxID=1494466 RepID=UPI002361212F|nr:zinc-binding dehydrogenase [Burkholderia sp. FERM BP-3421]WDD92292.1 zinc-binding dehydrogenase [Burkholderia sp. FERM BP-3421]